MQFGVALLAGLAIALLPSIHNNYSTVLTFPFIKPELFKLNLGLALHPVHHGHPRRRVERRESHRRPRRTGHRLDAHRRRDVHRSSRTPRATSAIADYLRIAWVPQTGELAVFCGAMVGASLGFLWFNAHPAEIFMGDVGSLALGGAIGCLAVMIKQEILLVLVGGLFVVEALSVIIQVASFKITGRRVFKMSPLHHHFELSGWKETKVVVRFWIIAIIFALLCAGDAETAMKNARSSVRRSRGVAAANFLADAGRATSCSPTRSAIRRCRTRSTTRVERAFGRDDDALLDGVDEIVVSPGVPLDDPAAAEAAASAHAGRSARSSSRTAISTGTVIAVTGSNGKSTTTALIGEILRRRRTRSRSSPATSASR